MKVDNIPTYQQFKNIVHDEFIKIYKDKGFKLSHVYQEKSKQFGFKNWNTLSAYLKSNDKDNGICWSCENKRIIGNGSKTKVCLECR